MVKWDNDLLLLVCYFSLSTHSHINSLSNTQNTHSHIHLYTRRLCWRTCFHRFCYNATLYKKPPQTCIRVGRPQQDENAKHPLTAAVVLSLSLSISTFNFAVVEQGRHTHSHKTVRARHFFLRSRPLWKIAARSKRADSVGKNRAAALVFCSAPLIWCRDCAALLKRIIIVCVIFDQRGVRVKNQIRAATASSYANTQTLNTADTLT